MPFPAFGTARPREKRRSAGGIALAIDAISRSRSSQGMGRFCMGRRAAVLERAR